MLALDHTLRPVPRLEVNTVESGCNGVAGRLPVRGSDGDRWAKSPAGSELEAFIAPGMTGCRHRIVDRPDRQARHAADVLEQALP